MANVQYCIHNMVPNDINMKNNKFIYFRHISMYVSYKNIYKFTLNTCNHVYTLITFFGIQTNLPINLLKFKIWH